MRYAIGVVAAVLVLAGGAWGQEDEPGELDVIVTSRLETPKEHGAAYRESLRKGVERAMGSLKPKTYSDDEKPRDGAARFRLLVEHRGAVLIGNMPTSERSPGADGQDTVSWQLQTGQEGEIGFRFLQWEGGRYKPQGGWSIPAGQDAPGGRIEVATETISQRQPTPPRMPIPLAEAQSQALRKLIARDVAWPLLEGLIGVRLLGADVREEDDRPRGFAEVEVMNRSPWPIEKVTVSVEWAAGPRKAFRVTLDHGFERRLLMRQAARFRGEGWAGEADPGRPIPARATAATFSPAPRQSAGGAPAGKGK